MEEFRNSLREMSDQELAAFNREVGNRGWTSSRGAYLAALQDEFDRRGIDYSAIGDKNGISFANKIRLAKKKVVIEKKD